MQKKVVVEKDGVKKDISFRKILLNRCQKEFEKENSIEKTINEKLADLVNQGLNVSTATELITFISWSLCFLFCLMFVHRVSLRTGDVFEIHME